MQKLTCTACNAPLEQGRPRYMRCTNVNCPAGGEFRRCGYCGMFSQAVKDRAAECYNASCRFHHVRLSVCPTCKRYAFMARRGGEPFCLWRDCPSNESIVQDCEFCGNRSFLRADGVDMCAKSKCPALLKQILQCVFCQRWMVDGSTDKCLNAECEHHDETIVTCSTCDQKTYSLDHDKCWNPECPTVTKQKEPSLAEEIDFDSLHTLAPMDPADDEPVQPVTAAPVSGERPPKSRPDGSDGEATLPPGDEIDISSAAPAKPFREPPPPQERVQPKRVSPSRDSGDPVAPPASEARVPLRDPSPPLREPEPRTPTPSLREAPSASLRSGIRISDGGPIDLAGAFRAVRQGLLSSDDGKYCPLILVMGTAGSGKTAFLATLGKILRDGSSLFAFPHPGVAAEPIRYDPLVDLMMQESPGHEPVEVKKELKARIEDLVFSYSSEIFDNYIARGIWCEFTKPDFGQFLVANVTRRGQPLANIVTLETSGENFQSLLKSINDLGDLEHSGTPIVRTMAEMLTLAQGLIIVMDPSSTTNDQVYQPFFAHLTRHLGHRVHTDLDREIKAYLDRSDVRQRFKKGATATERISPLHREGAQEAARKELEELRGLLTRNGALAIESERPRFQRALDAISRGPKSGIGAKIQARIDNSSGDMQVEVELWAEVLKRVDATVLADELFPEVSRSEDELTISSEQALARQICVKHGVGAEIAKHFDLEAGPTNMESAFPHLRDIALVFSKSDMHPVVYPPDGFPRLKLPATCTALERCESYLRFQGGALRYYNTSVLGYSACANGQFFPGNEASLTPVNVIEPVFDMLSDKLTTR